jgi:hypothetical protein
MRNALRFKSGGVPPPGDWLRGVISSVLLFLLLIPQSAFAAVPGLQEQIPGEEYAALVALFGATDGNRWSDKAGWGDGNASKWDGVVVLGTEYDNNGEVSKQGHVINLNLVGNGLKGTLPDEFDQLKELAGLDLRSNQLTGSLSSSLDGLSKLSNIRLSGNNFSGSLPDYFQELSLVILHLNGNELTGTLPTWLGTLTNLRELDLSSNEFSGSIPDNLNQLQKLTALGLGDNRLTGSIPATLTQFPFLLTLYLPDNQLSGDIPLTLGQLTNTPFAGVWVDLRGNCLDLGNAAAVKAALPATARFDYSPQGECVTIDPPDLRSTFFEVVEGSVDWVNPITVRFKVENRGQGFSEPYRVSFYLSADPNDIGPGSELLKTVLLPGLAPLESTAILTETIELPMTVTKAGPTGAPNQFYIGIVVDPFEQITEADEANNYRPILGVGYDSIKIFGSAIISSEEFDAHRLDHPGEGFDPGDEMRVDYHLVNVGYGDAEPFHLEFLWDPPLGSKLSDGYLGRVHIAEGLEAGSETFGFFIATLPLDGSDAYEPTGNGTYLVKPALDPFRLESFAFHNPFYTGDEIYGDEVLMLGLCADLKAGEFTINVFEPDFQPGESVPLVFSFRNDSPVELTTDFTIGIVLSRDPIIDPAVDLLIGQVIANGAARHTRHTFNDVSVNLPPAGDPFWLPGNQTYYMGMVLDLNAEVLDCSLADNITLPAHAGVLNVNTFTHGTGGGVNSGTGASATPYALTPGQVATGVNAEAGARFHFGTEGLESGRLSRFRFERELGSGVLYIRLGGGVARPDDYDHRIIFDDDYPGPIDFHLNTASGGVRFLVDATGGLTGGSLKIAQAGSPPPMTELVPSDYSSENIERTAQYGRSVAATDSLIAVGNPTDDVNGALSGSLYLYRWDGFLWDEIKLTASDGEAGDQFGYRVAVSDEVIVVGSPHDEDHRGSLYVYRWDGRVWNETKIPLPAASFYKGATSARFGTSVSISGNRIAVGAPGYGASAGAGTYLWDSGIAYLFEWNGAIWEKVLTVGYQGQAGDLSGASVAISGDHFVVGAPGISSQVGVVYSYHWNGATWDETVLNPTSPLAGNQFGASLAAFSGSIAVGAPGTLAGKGRLHVYDWNLGQWSNQSLINGSDTLAGDAYGPMSLADDILVASSKRGTYLHRLESGSWDETKILTHPAAGIAQSPSLSASGNTVAVGGVGERPICHVFNLAEPAAHDGTDSLLNRYFSAEYIAANRDTILSNDPDRDGTVTLVELFMGTHPLVMNINPSPLTLTSVGGEFQIEVRRHQDSGHLNAVLMTSTNLRDWIQAPAQPVLHSSNSETGEELWRSTLPVENSLFLRLDFFE